MIVGYYNVDRREMLCPDCTEKHLKFYGGIFYSVKKEEIKTYSSTGICGICKEKFVKGKDENEV